MGKLERHGKDIQDRMEAAIASDNARAKKFLKWGLIALAVLVVCGIGIFVVILGMLAGEIAHEIWQQRQD